MMSFAPSNLSQGFRAPKLIVKVLTLLLRASILPVGTVRMGKSSRHLLHQRLVAVQTLHGGFSILGPENSAVLHAGSGNTSHFAEIESGFLEALEHKVDGFEPHGCRSVDFALGWVGKDALLDTIIAQVSVEVDFGLVTKL